MAGKKIGIVLAVDGEKDFKQALSNANKEAQKFKSELNKLNAEYDGNANSIEYLQKKQEALAKETEAYRKRVQAAKKGLENAESAQKKAADRYAELKTELEKAKKAQQELTEAGRSGTKEYQKQVTETESYQKALEKQKAELEKCEGKVSEWSAKLNNAESDLTKVNRTLNQNEQYLKEAETATDHCATSIDEFGKATKEASEETSSFAENIARGFETKIGATAFDTLKDAASAAAEAIKETALDSSAASADLAASTGLSTSAAQKYEKVMKQIRGDNFGESYQDVADVMAETIQIMGELNESDMTGVVEGAITLRDTFDMDVNETLRAVDVMVQTMGVDATEAFNLIATGAQNGLNRSGELTDNITEYGQLWAQAGFSAEEMFSILENGLDAGAYNLDKVNDYVKEFGVSLADGRVEDHLDSFSEQSQQLFEQWKNGEASTKDVFYSIIDDLSKMENQQEALTIASDVWSALGEDNSMAVLTALDDLNTGYENVKGTMESLQDVKYSDLGSAVSGLGAAVQEKFITPIATGISDVLTPAITTATELIGGLGGEDIDSQLTAITEMVDSAKSANDELERSLENGKATMENAQLDATELETLGQQLISLNAVEEKSSAQKYQLKAVVDALGESIPEIAAAYSEETAQVNLSDQAIQSLISSTKELMVAQAAQEAAQEAATALVKAQVEYENAQTAAAAANDKAAMYKEEQQLLTELQSEYAAYQMAVSNAVDSDAIDKIESTMTNASEVERRYLEFWNEQLESGRATLEEYNEALEYAAIGQFSNRLYANEAAVQQWDGTAAEAATTAGELEENMNSASGELDAYTAAAADLENKLSAQNDAQDEAAQEIEKTTEAAVKCAPAIDGIGNAAEETLPSLEEIGETLVSTATGVGDASAKFKVGSETISESAESVAKSVEASSDTQKSAMEGLLDTYTSTMESIEADIQDKINPFDKFDGGSDVTVEDMLANLQSQTEGLQKYQENLQTITDTMGDQIAPEFLQYIESMGTDGANMLQHMVDTLDQENGAELIKQMSDEYVEAMDLSEGIAQAGAANEVAYQQAMGELGSSEADFTDLQDTISEAISGATENADSAWNGLDDATRGALEQVVTTAQECGVQIPEGLAEGIASGEVSPTDAIAQMKGSLEGTFDGLAEIARENGISIPEELSAGLEAGGQQAVAAFQQICELINANTGTALSSGAQEAASEGTEAYAEAGANAGDAVVTGIQEKESEIQTAVVEAISADGVSGDGTSFQAIGEQVAESIATGITNKKSAITDAISAALSSAEGTSGGSGFDTIGSQVAESIAAGIGNGGETINAQVTAIAAAAAEQLSGNTSGFTAEGAALAKAVANGILSGKGTAVSAATSLASQALAGMRTYQNSGYSIGANIASGVASGIRAGTSGAISAAVNLAAQALAAAKNRLNIKSPSRTFREEVGQQIAKGMAFGISDKASLAGKEASNMSAKVYNNATKWLAQYKKSQTVSLEDEKYYWQQVLNHTKSGTTAYNNALKKIKSISISELTASGLSSEAASKIVNNFGVSKTTTTGSGKKKKTTTKSDADYYSEIYQAAEEYMSNLETVSDVSVKQQLLYWKTVQSGVKSGTDAWYSAQQKINSLQSKIGTVSNMSTILSNYQTYYDMSEKAVMDYWDTVRQQYAEGTDERLEADEKYYDAHEEYTEKLKDLEEDYLDSVQDVNEKLADSLADLDEEYSKELEDRTSELKDAFDLFDEFTSESASGKELLFNIKTQAAGYEDWMQQIDELAAKGILDNSLIEELTEQGPEISASIHALNTLTEEELKEYNAAYLKKMELSKQQATEDTEALRQEVADQKATLQAQAAKDTEELKQAYEANVASVNATMTTQLQSLAESAKSIAEDQTTQLVAAITGLERKDGTVVSSGSTEAASTASTASSAAPTTETTTAASTTSAATTSSSTDKILSIINSGASTNGKKLTSAERKKHVALYEYIWDNYGRKATNAMYKKLGKALDITVSSTVTSKQKTKILNKLKKKGYRSGGRNIQDELIWMDEELDQKGGELIVRKSDNALLTRIQPGDDIIDADTTQNIVAWGKLDPEGLFSLIEKQQDAAKACLDEIGALTGLGTLNRLLDTGSQQISQTLDTSGLEARMERMETLMQDCIDRIQMVAERPIVLDSGEMVSATAGKMSQEMAAIGNRRRRR